MMIFCFFLSNLPYVCFSCPTALTRTSAQCLMEVMSEPLTLYLNIRGKAFRMSSLTMMFAIAFCIRLKNIKIGDI